MPRGPRPSEFRRVFLKESFAIPVLWVEGTAADCKPVTEIFTNIREALNAAAGAANLGLCFRLDFYHAPISDTESQEEAHLTVWKEIKSDACMLGRSSE